MNIRERLNERLRQCREDYRGANLRAAEAGHWYVERRLAQLETQFPRHGFGWRSPTAWQKGLLIVPAIRGWHDAERALAPLQQRCRSERLHKLQNVSHDLYGWAQLIEREFGQSIPNGLSPKLKLWGVVLEMLPPQPQPLHSGSGMAGLLRHGGSDRMG